MASQQLRVVVRNLEFFVEKLIQKITLDIVANLQRTPSDGGTPVDTGWARANWIPRIGARVEGPTGSREQAEAFKGSGGFPTGASGAGSASVVSSYRLSLGSVFISNSVPYITRLNAGHSKQAPSGFVQRAIFKAVTEDIRR